MALTLAVSLTELLTLTLADSDCTTGGGRKDGHKGGAKREGDGGGGWCGERSPRQDAASHRIESHRIASHRVARVAPVARLARALHTPQTETTAASDVLRQITHH